MDGHTITAAYAIERGVTRPSMLISLATLRFVAFFRDFEVRHCFFLAEPLSSASTKYSEDEGDINILANVWAGVLVRERLDDNQLN